METEFRGIVDQAAQKVNFLWIDRMELGARKIYPSVQELVGKLGILCNANKAIF